MTYCPWDKFQHATIRFCEEELCAWVTQPSNTWSNLAFIIVGIIIFLKCRKENTPLLQIIGISSIVTGVGSFLFHMTSTFMFEFLDLTGMFMISAVLLILNFQRLLGWNKKTVFLGYFVVVIFSSLSLLVWAVSGIPLFALQITIALTLEVLIHIKDIKVDYSALLVTVLLFVAAFLVWILDIKGILCDPKNHLITGHAVWHFLNAGAIYYIYLFYKKNHPKFLDSKGVIDG